jgi:ATP-dependent helicase Lhr and Lhr-like helicase
MLLLGGRSWKVTHVDWERRRCFVEPADGGGRAKWSGSGGGVSYDIARGMRDIVLGALPDGVTFTARATTVVEELRHNYGDNVATDRLIVRLPSDSTGRWWTWAGTSANRTLQASLPAIVDPRQRIDEKSMRLLPGVTVDEFAGALAAVEWRDPDVDVNALRGLKFSAALPEQLAKRTLSARLGDTTHAAAVSAQSRSIVR